MTTHAVGGRALLLRGLAAATRAGVLLGLLGLATWVGLATESRTAPPRLVAREVHAPVRQAPDVLCACLDSIRPEPAFDAYRVAVIDMFYPGDDAFGSDEAREVALLSADAVDVDGDGERDGWYHGDIVSLYAARVGVKTIPHPVKHLATSKREILRHLETIAEQARAGHGVDGVILAWESSAFQSAFGEPIRPDRARAYKELVRQWGESSLSWYLTHRIIGALEEVTAQGVEVFTISGNGGRRALNAYSLADGVQTVGGEEEDANGRWFAQNPFVDVVAQGVYRVRLLHDAAGTPVGYDLDEDGECDVPLDRVSSHRRARPCDREVILKGSSFAAPTWFRERLAVLAR